MTFEEKAEKIAEAVIVFLYENSRTGRHQPEDENYKEVLTHVIYEAL